MALPSYLDLVNSVLIRMREPQVSTVNENTLSSLIGALVNDSKRQVEDAYSWNALTQTLTTTTTPGVFNYVLVGSGARFKTIEVYDNTIRQHLRNIPSVRMTSNFFTSATPQRGVPTEYNYNGVNSDGDTQVDLFPIPDNSYQIFFNLYIPQEKLVNDADMLIVPSEPVMLLAFARALVERGEDGGLNSSEAYALSKAALYDFIAIESSRYPEEDSWYWV